MDTHSSSTTAALTSFRRQLRLLEREVLRELESQTDCCGVTLAQCHVLLEIAGSTLSLTGLSEALDLDRSTLSRTVDSLVKAGLVERSDDPADRRSLRLALTPSGAAKVGFIDESCNRYYAALLEGLGEDDLQHVMRGVEIMARRLRGCRLVGLQGPCSLDAPGESEG